MKQLFLFLILAICLSCSDGNSGLPPSKEDSPIAVKTNDSVVADVAARLANPLLIVARSVYAGNDINATTSKITLSGSSNVNNNTWSQKSGPNQAVFSSKIDLKATVSNLINGKYWFILSGDYRGRKYRDSVKVLVSLASNVPPAVKNKIPVVSAGPDVTITLPTSIVTLNGSANDSDGKIVSSSWKGNAGTILTPPNLSTQITGLAAGRYTYTFTATDDSSASASDQVIVTVNAPIVIPPVDTVVTPPPPPPPTGNNADPVTTPKVFNDFETSLTNPGFNSWVQQAYDGKAPGPMATLSTEQHVSGNKSAKFTLIAGYTQATGQAHTQLTQIDVSGAAITEGTDKWYSSDYYLVSTAASPYPTDIQYLRQWHHDKSDGSPPLALCTWDNKLQLNYYTGYPNGKDVFYDAGSYPLNKWFHVTMHVKFSSKSGTALTEVWIDGVKTASKGDPNMFAGINNITMFGLYKWIWKLTSYNKALTTTIFADNYKEW